MGKNLRQQRRGRGGSQYRSPSHRHLGDIRMPHTKAGTGRILDLVHAPGRTSPLAEVDLDGKVVNIIAAEGIQVGQQIEIGNAGTIASGNVMSLGSIPEGTLVFNIEARPGDGGKFVRSSGTGAAIVSRGEKVVVQMPSGAFKAFDPTCRASIGIVAGGGHTEKPFGKAGAKFHAYRSKSKAHFKVRGVAMNPVDHPHGGGSHQHVGKPSTVGRNAPPGRKVGRLSPKRKVRM
ncbi:MAG: 50S ribosomal protein L2 [Methanomassiliicoccales archaeon]|nr:50S ribosomal protein L2 [Methanomassiliicoccales archaeon]